MSESNGLLSVKPTESEEGSVSSSSSAQEQRAEPMDVAETGSSSSLLRAQPQQQSKHAKPIDVNQPDEEKEQDSGSDSASSEASDDEEESSDENGEGQAEGKKKFEIKKVIDVQIFEKTQLRFVVVWKDGSPNYLNHPCAFDNGIRNVHILNFLKIQKNWMKYNRLLKTLARSGVPEAELAEIELKTKPGSTGRGRKRKALKPTHLMHPEGRAGPSGAPGPSDRKSPERGPNPDEDDVPERQEDQGEGPREIKEVIGFCTHKRCLLFQVTYDGSTKKHWKNVLDIENGINNTLIQNWLGDRQNWKKYVRLMNSLQTQGVSLEELAKINTPTRPGSNFRDGGRKRKLLAVLPRGDSEPGPSRRVEPQRQVVGKAQDLFGDVSDSDEEVAVEKLGREMKKVQMEPFEPDMDYESPSFTAATQSSEPHPEHRIKTPPSPSPLPPASENGRSLVRSDVVVNPSESMEHDKIVETQNHPVEKLREEMPDRPMIPPPPSPTLAQNARVLFPPASPTPQNQSEDHQKMDILDNSRSHSSSSEWDMAESVDDGPDEEGREPIDHGRKKDVEIPSSSQSTSTKNGRGQLSPASPEVQHQDEKNEPAEESDGDSSSSSSSGLDIYESPDEDFDDTESMDYGQQEIPPPPPSSDPAQNGRNSPASTIEHESQEPHLPPSQHQSGRSLKRAAGPSSSDSDSEPSEADDSDPEEPPHSSTTMLPTPQTPSKGQNLGVYGRLLKMGTPIKGLNPPPEFAKEIAEIERSLQSSFEKALQKQFRGTFDYERRFALQKFPMGQNSEKKQKSNFKVASVDKNTDYGIVVFGMKWCDINNEFLSKPVDLDKLTVRLNDVTCDEKITFGKSSILKAANVKKENELEVEFKEVSDHFLVARLITLNRNIENEKLKF